MKDKYNSVNQLMKDKNDDKIITSSEREDREEIQSTIPLIEEINTNIFCFFPLSINWNVNHNVIFRIVY